VLKKLTATGILAGAATGVVLLGGPANADRLAASPSAVADVPAACSYTTPGYVPPAWCTNYAQNPYYPPTTYYPGYNYGWNRWHHGGWGGYPHQGGWGGYPHQGGWGGYPHHWRLS
jgi:hypothetical protein